MLPSSRSFVTFVNEALVVLEERFNITPPITDTVAEITARIYQEFEVLHEIDESSTGSELHEALDLTSDEIEAAIRSLEHNEAIAIDGNQITKNSSTL